MKRLILLAIASAWFSGQLATDEVAATHGQTAVYPVVDYLALDAVNEGGNGEAALQPGEPPWDTCVTASPGETVNIDVVVDRIPVIPDVDDPAVIGSRSGVTEITVLLEWDYSRLIRRTMTSPTLLAAGKPSFLTGEGTAITLEPRVDQITIREFLYQEEDIEGVGLRVPFTIQDGAEGLAKVEILDAYEGASSGIFAGSFEESVPLSIGNFAGGLQDGDSSDTQQVYISIGSSCDDDGDGVLSLIDNCPSVSNPDQVDTDGDGEGDACDADDDNDSVADGLDPCPTVPNENPTDSDGDLKPDACDGAGSGNVDCSAPPTGVSAADALKVLRYVAGLSVTQDEPCLEIGSGPLTSGWMQGDVNCSGGQTPVNAVDALLILRYVAAIPVSLPQGCPAIGGP